MLKSGDVLVAEERQLELLGGTRFADVRQGKAEARRLIENADEPSDQVIIRVERVARAKARKPAFDCAFDDEDAKTEPGEGGAA